MEATICELVVSIGLFDLSRQASSQLDKEVNSPSGDPGTLSRQIW
jgi:hypothetical protein